MKLIQLKIVTFLRKNVEIVLLVFLLIISVFITQLYNFNTKKIQKDYLNIISNSYFKKSINHFFSNLKPKFEKIEYKIKPGDTLFNILNNLSVNETDIQKITKLLNKNSSKNFNQNQIIGLTLENTRTKKKVVSIMVPVSPSRKLEIIREIENNSFTKREIVTNLKKKLFLKKELSNPVYTKVLLKKESVLI